MEHAASVFEVTETFIPEPDCTCGLHVDRADLSQVRGCEFHDPNSAHNVALFGETAVDPETYRRVMLATCVSELAEAFRPTKKGMRSAVEQKGVEVAA